VQPEGSDCFICIWNLSFQCICTILVVCYKGRTPIRPIMQKLHFITSSMSPKYPAQYEKQCCHLKVGTALTKYLVLVTWETHTIWGLQLSQQRAKPCYTLYTFICDVIVSKISYKILQWSYYLQLLPVLSVLCSVQHCGCSNHKHKPYCW